MSTRSLFIVVPVLNEAGNMGRLMKSFQEIAVQFGDKFQVRFIMVDDGSTDGTAELARSLAGNLSFEVLVHEVNRGPGAAFATAFSRLASLMVAGDLVVTTEGDNTSRLELLDQMMTRIREGFDVVLASPYLYGGGILNTATHRVLLSHVANLLVKETLGLHGIATMSSFFRLYRAEILLRLQSCYGPGIVERTGFESMIEMLLKITYLRAGISEVAMTLDTSQRVGKSKMKVVRTALSYLTLWKHRPAWQMQAAPGVALNP